MFRIGEFARLAQVSVKTLHHYHDIGLVMPAAVGPATGYRLYAPAQLADLNRVLAMRDLGFSLDEIASLRGATAEGLALALAARRQALDDEIVRLEARKRSIDARLAIAGHTAADIVVRPLPAQFVASLRAPLPADGDVSALFVELEEHVHRHRARAPLPPLMLYHDWAGGDPGEVEVVVPLTEEVPPTPRIHVGWLPAVPRALCLARCGPYERLVHLRATFAGWLGDGRRAAPVRVGPLREVFVRFVAEAHLGLPARYLTDRADELVTEYQLPLT